MIDKTLFNKLLTFGVEKGASDIHFQVGGPPRYRIKGDLFKAKFDKLTPEDTQLVAELVLGERIINLTGLFNEQDTSYAIPGIARFRASVFRQRGSIGVVMRVIPLGIPSFDDLNLPPWIRELSNLRRGLILVTGATGNGKSTTIASLLQQINLTRNAHIVTIEDPIEFLFENERSLIVQREVGTDTHSYSDAMVSVLRQDPDIIMLGEIRDAETAAVCLKAAETGHFVISTLHTPDVPSSIKRLLGFFDGTQADVQLSRLADCLQAIVSQRLLQHSDGMRLVPAVEIMRVTHLIQECIRDLSRHGEISEHISKGRELYGMQTFEQHLVDLVQNNTITIDTARHAASRPAELERALMLE